eukprot:202868-Prymnesium_polylepis.1
MRPNPLDDVEERLLKHGARARAPARGAGAARAACGSSLPAKNERRQRVLYSSRNSTRFVFAQPPLSL